MKVSENISCRLAMLRLLGKFTCVPSHSWTILLHEYGQDVCSDLESKRKPRCMAVGECSARDSPLTISLRCFYRRWVRNFGNMSKIKSGGEL